jgi:nitrate/nitrite-specific signal transduction histidine kinase
MNWVRDLPIKRKLTLAIMGTCSAVLLLACVALEAWQMPVLGGIEVFLGCGLVAFVLASWLQRPISQPILALTEAVRKIVEHKDFSVRLPAPGRDEMGILTDAFNHLLAGIRERDAALRTANESSSRSEAQLESIAKASVAEQLARLALLSEITRAVGERLDMQSIFQMVAHRLEDELPLDFCCVCLYDPAASALRLSQAGARGEAFAAGLALGGNQLLAVDENGLERCVSGGLVYEPDVAESEFQFSQRLARAGLRAFVAVPMLVEGDLFGMVIAARRRAESFSSGDCEFLRQLSEHAALAVHQAQLHTALQQACGDLRQSRPADRQQEWLRGLSWQENEPK